MGKLYEILGLAQYESGKNQQFSKRLAALSGYCITTVPLLFF